MRKTQKKAKRKTQKRGNKKGLPQLTWTAHAGVDLLKNVVEGGTAHVVGVARFPTFSAIDVGANRRTSAAISGRDVRRAGAASSGTHQSLHEKLTYQCHWSYILTFDLRVDSCCW